MASSSPSNKCSACGRPEGSNEKLKHCAGCAGSDNAPKYCSRECQVKAWKAGHKAECASGREGHQGSSAAIDLESIVPSLGGLHGAININEEVPAIAKALVDSLKRPVAALVADLSPLVPAEKQVLAAISLGHHLGVDKKVCMAAASAGAIPPLVKLLSSDVSAVRGTAVGALAPLASHPATCKRVWEARGAVPAILGLLPRPGSNTEKFYAATCIAAFSDHFESHGVLVAAGAIPALLRLVANSSIFSQLTQQSSEKMKIGVVHSLGNFYEASASSLPSSSSSFSSSSFLDQVGRAPEVLPALREMLNSATAEMGDAASRLLGHLSTHPDNGVRIARAGIIIPLVRLLDAGPATVHHHVLTAVFHLSKDLNIGDDLIAAGIIHSLARLLHSSNRTTQHMAAAGLSHLALDADARVEIAAVGLIIPRLVALLKPSSSAAIRAVATITLCHLSQDHKVQSDIIAAGGVPPLVGLLGSSSLELQTAAAAACCSLCSSEEGQEALVASGALPCLTKVLMQASASPELLKHVTVSLASLSMGSKTERDLGPAVIPRLIDLMQSKSADLQEAAVRNVGFLADRCPTSRAQILGDDSVVPFLDRLLASSPYGGVRVEATKALMILQRP